MRAKTVKARIFCAKTTGKQIVVWGYQFDSHKDYLAGLAHISSFTGFGKLHPAGICPPPRGKAAGLANPVIWRGSRREVDLMFGNVRDAGWLPDEHFLARPGTWRFIIDLPFDQPGHSGIEDHARLDRMTAGGVRSQTIVWLRDKLGRAIQECYGAAAPTPGNLAPGDPDERVLVSLHSGFSPAAPVGADLGAAFGNLVDQAFSAIYPAHPRFEPPELEVTVRDLSAVYANVARAVADPEGRVRLEGDIAAVRRVAGPLGVGTVGETHFLFGDDRFTPWSMEFEKAAAKDGIQLQDPVAAERVREWIQALKPLRGLRPEVEDLIILAWAERQQRAWFQHGSPMQSRSWPRSFTVLRSSACISDRSLLFRTGMRSGPAREESVQGLSA